MSDDLERSVLFESRPAGPEAGRVAEILVSLPNGKQARRGSGYLVSSETVITAAHVVSGALAVRVRLNADQADEWAVDVGEWAEYPAADLALLAVPARGEVPLAPCSFGRIGDRDAVVQCSAVGFPRFKLRRDRRGLYRDSCHVAGAAAVLSNRRERTLEVSVPAPAEDPDPAVSPWEGMSGAVVFSAGRVVAMISEHHRSDGLGRLAATRVDRWFELLSPTDLRVVGDRLGLPVRRDDLPDVVSKSGDELNSAAYTAQAREIAPAVLEDRDGELAELTAFCAGNEPYTWWQAPPWAGKSALSAWFTLHAPPGVLVVPFFVTARLAGQADSDAFTEALIEQLAVIVGEPATAQVSARDALRRHLIERTARYLSAQGSRLVLLIDGLDEDQGNRHPSDRPSIASLLPRRPADGLRVIVTSRPHPGIPLDVPADHPLRGCRTRALTSWRGGLDTRDEAKRELLGGLHGNPLDREVIAFLAASGGGLTPRDLSELTGEPRWQVSSQLDSAFGRILSTRGTGKQDEPAYIFAHDTLRVIVEEILDPDLPLYRQRILTWAAVYSERGWPADTPRYFLQAYARLLAAMPDAGPLASIACDQARHDWMLQQEGAAAAVAEITSAQRRLLSQNDPDLLTLVRIAVERDRLASRARAIPVNLPAVLEMLGQAEHAGELAAAMPTALARAQALAQLTTAAAVTDPLKAAQFAAWAEREAQAVPETSHDSGIALGCAAQALAAAGEWDRSEETPAQIEVAAAMAAAGLPDRAEQHARRALRYRDSNEIALVAAALAVTDPSRGRQLAREARDAALDRASSSSFRKEALARTARVLSASYPDLSHELVTEADQVPRQEGYWEEEALSELARAMAALGLWDRAERTARRITWASVRATTLARIAATIGDAAPVLAADLIGEAEHLVRGWCIGTEDAAATLADMAEALAGFDPGVAARLAGEAERQAPQVAVAQKDEKSLLGLASALAVAGLWEQATKTAMSISDSLYQAWALDKVSASLASSGQSQQAAEAASLITRPGERSRALGRIARLLAAGDPGRAASSAEQADAAAAAIADPVHQRLARKELAMTLATEGLWDKAEEIARAIPMTGDMCEALARIAVTVAGADPDRARQLADEVESAVQAVAGPTERERIQAEVPQALAAAGQLDQAERAARSIFGPHEAEQALSGIPAKLAGAGLWDLAERELAASKYGLPGTTGPVLARIASAVAGTDPARASRLADAAERDARTIDDAEERARALASIARELGSVDPTLAARLAIEAEAGTHASTNWPKILEDVTRAYVSAGLWPRAEALWDQAERAALDVSGPPARADVLRALASQFLEPGLLTRCTC